MLATGLEKFGYSVRQARDGSKGIADFHAEPVDVVITDLVMPNKEGIATITELRRLAPALPIIAMSGLPARPALFKDGGPTWRDGDTAKTLRSSYPLRGHRSRIAGRE